MAKIASTISITRLPPNHGMIISLSFFPVSGPDSPPPYDGDPPEDAATDNQQVFKNVDLSAVQRGTEFERDFDIERSPGCYYVQVRVILFRPKKEKTFAQVEPFFFARRPLHVVDGSAGHVTFPISWPTDKIEDLEVYGEIRPESKRPWWRFW